jgi:AmmeMemoRadiSam system protein B
MDGLQRPCLRQGLDVALDNDDPRYVYLCDQLRLASQPQRLTIAEFTWVQLFNGVNDLRTIQSEAMRRAGGALIPIDRFEGLAARLDKALFLDGERFRERLSSPVREPSCLGCYADDPAQLRGQLERYFTGKSGPGLPAEKRPDGKLRAALIPHIDYARGGTTYAWGFKEVFERSDASLFVIVGTSHYSGHRFSLTRKNFKSPLGIVLTDQAAIDTLVAHYGDGLFDDELAHLPEHSIELEVVFLQYLYENRRQIRIVPLIVGPFQDAIELGRPPREMPDIRRMIEALRLLEKEIAEPICFIISGDLAHIGPKFGDAEPVGAGFLARSRQMDEAILEQAERGAAEGYFRIIAEENDRRRICGLPPTYTVLDDQRPMCGRVLHYDQYLHPRGFESVSFASMAFYR